MSDWELSPSRPRKGVVLTILAVALLLGAAAFWYYLGTDPPTPESPRTQGSPSTAAGTERAVLDAFVAACRAGDATKVWALTSTRMKQGAESLASDFRTTGDRGLLEHLGYGGEPAHFTGREYLAATLKRTGQEGAFDNPCWGAAQWSIEDVSDSGLYVARITRADGHAMNAMVHGGTVDISKLD